MDFHKHMAKIRRFYKRILLILLLILVIQNFSCKKDDGSEIPNVYVNFTLLPNSLDFIEIGGWIYINDQGYRGIIIYRPQSDIFYAYERTCTHDADVNTAQVEVEDSGITVVDSTCMSRFILLDGTPFDGPATIPLKQYRTAYDGNILQVFN